MDGDEAGSVRPYKAILARFSDHYIVNYNMGIPLRLAGRPRRGAAYVRRAIRVWPENPLAHAGLGRLLFDMGEPRRALRSIDRALALQPGYGLALDDRGEALKALGRGGGRGAGRRSTCRAARRAPRCLPTASDGRLGPPIGVRRPYSGRARGLNMHCMPKIGNL